MDLKSSTKYPVICYASKTGQKKRVNGLDDNLRHKTCGHRLEPVNAPTQALSFLLSALPYEIRIASIVPRKTLTNRSFIPFSGD